MNLIKFIAAIIFLLPVYSFPQVEIQNVGLKNKSITSLKFWYGILAVGTENNGVYWSQIESPDSIDWKHIELPGKNIRTVYPHKSGPIGWAIGAGIRPLEGDTNFVYCSYMGEKFKPISKGIDRNRTYEISKLDGFPDPTICGETFAAGGGKLYRRFFGDTIWHSVYDLTIEGNFTSVNVRQNYPTVIAGGGEGFANHLLIKSMDKGDTWEDISPIIFVHSLDFTDDSAKVIFVTDMRKIRKSDDFGSTWNDVFNTDGQFIINKLRYHPDLNTIFAVGTTEGYLGRVIIYYNEINNEEWINIPIDILNSAVDLDYGPDNWIYIATIDSGIYRFRNVVVKVENEIAEIPTQFSLSQNYPNPFNPITTIEYTLPAIVKSEKSNGFIPSGFEGELVQLKIYDVLGREVTTLVNEVKKPGVYPVAFIADNLSSGIYYYRLKIDNYVKTKKMILLK